MTLDVIEHNSCNWCYRKTRSKCPHQAAHCTVYFWADFCPVKVKLKFELFKKIIDIVNYNAHGVTKLIFKTNFKK
jgi:hypothetical protein